MEREYEWSRWFGTGHKQAAGIITGNDTDVDCEEGFWLGFKQIGLNRSYVHDDDNGRPTLSVSVFLPDEDARPWKE